jgi:hypothetical protein
MERFVRDIDPEHRLKAQAPGHLPVGPVRVRVLVPENRAGLEWTRGVASESADELADARQDIYRLDYGQ